jgi:DNA-binding NarL/FixJ family response regulator
MYVVVANVLAVGVSDKSGALKDLPIRLLVMDTGAEAVRCLQEERIATVISRWELVDMPQGKFLRNIIAARPNIPTIAFITPGDRSQETAARGLGVSAILNEDVDDEYFRETLCQLLGICTITNVKVADGYRASVDNVE